MLLLACFSFPCWIGLWELEAKWVITLCMEVFLGSTSVCGWKYLNCCHHYVPMEKNLFHFANLISNASNLSVIQVVNSLQVQHTVDGLDDGVFKLFYFVASSNHDNKIF